MYESWQKARERVRDEESKESGFTLIELLIVIVVLGILAAVVVFALGGVTTQSAVASCNSDAKSMVVAVEAYKAFPGNNNSYPAAGYDLTASTNGGPYLRSAPGTSHYQIKVAASGVINVYKPDGTTLIGPYDPPGGGANPCDSVS